MMEMLIPAWQWQSRAVLARHLRVHLRHWHTVTLPPVCEPLIMLLAFGIGLGSQIDRLDWHGVTIDYLTYLAPGILAYTTFMSSFFQSLFAAFIRMHFQKSWEGQLTTQVRLEHVVWGEAFWAASLATAYALIVCIMLGFFGLLGLLSLHWHWLPISSPAISLSVGFFRIRAVFYRDPADDRSHEPAVFSRDHPDRFCFQHVFPAAGCAGAHADRLDQSAASPR